MTTEIADDVLPEVIIDMKPIVAPPAVGIPPPPPPLPPLSILNSVTKPLHVSKYKKFYWKLVKKSNPKIVSSISFNYLLTNKTLPSMILNDHADEVLNIFIDPKVQELLQTNFLLQETSKSKTPLNSPTFGYQVNPTKFEYLKRNPHGTHNLKVLEVLKKTNWKNFQYDEILNIFIDCGKAWVNEVQSFSSFKIELKLDLKMELNRYNINDEFEFLEYLNYFKEYYHDKCALTMQIQELQDVMAVFKSNLNDFTHFNEVMLQEKVALDVLIKYVVKVVSLVNEDVLEENKLYCLDNLTKLKSCKRTNYYKVGDKNNNVDIEIDSLLDLVYLSIQDKPQLFEFLEKCVNFKKDIIKETNSCFKKTNLLLNSLSTLHLKTYLTVENDKFSKYLNSEFLKIKRSVVPLLEKYYHQMDTYNELVYEYETASINKVHINSINKFKIFIKPNGNVDMADILKCQCIEYDDNEPSLIEIMKGFLKDLQNTYSKYSKEREVVRSETPQPKRDINISELSILYEDIMTSDTLEQLKNYELKIHKERKLLNKTLHIDVTYTNIQNLIAKTRAL